MKIYSMTATFGKLSHQTLTFEPGLNVISAPNEWGKSTWCAFLTAMLYGIDTRERTTQTTLADKERYAPWSGEAMSGRIDLCWNGRDITIERRTKGRSIFSEFSAYETASGLPVPELTSGNCGQVLVGVEKTVFLRSAFIKLADMPVTQDEALRRRLNALVTTGDESNTGDTLAQKLKDLKNRCRHNKTGLLPQAELQQKQLQDTLSALENSNLQIAQIQRQQDALTEELRLLENHKAHLAYQAEKQNMERVETAKKACQDALDRVRQLEMQASELPSEAFAEKKLDKVQSLQDSWTQLQSKALPQIPEAPAAFAGLDGQQALQQAKSDKAAYDMLQKPVSPLLLILAAVCALIGIGLIFVDWRFALALAVPVAGFIALYFRNKAAQKKDLAAVCAKYGTLPPQQWIPTAEQYAEDRQGYNRAVSSYNTEKKLLTEETEALTGGKSLAEIAEEYRQVLKQWQTLAEARQVADRTAEHAEALSAMVRKMSAPTQPDTLDLSSQQTDQRISQITVQLQVLRERLGQFKGQAETLGNQDALTQQLAAVNARIEQLEKVYAALSFAQQTLSEAASELQRRFAPRISQRAQELFGKLTGSRYDRLQLTQDLSLHAGAVGEDTLRGSLWRSDGTVDQLYLALRLAVAEELIPDAPLVLDDAFVRFDDTRLAQAMDILKEQASTRQVILFTCQERESTHL